MSTVLIATDLVVRYHEQRVLDCATLAFEEHDRVGLVGRNGCGKTTFLKIIAGLQTPDSGTVTQRRNLVISYLPQEFTLDPQWTVYENVRGGAQHVLDCIAEFEALPAAATRHAELEERIVALDGWSLDHRIKTTLSHLNCPDGERRVDSLSGGEKRRVAMARAIVSRPDFLILDEPTNHLDPESIEWVAEFLENFNGTFLVVTHDRYFLDRVARRVVELSDGRFFSHEGNYTDYLLDKAERQAADAVVEHKRQMFLRRELEWVRRGPPAQRTKSKIRFEKFDEVAAQAGPGVEEEVELCIPPPPPLGNRVVDCHRVGVTLGGNTLFRGFDFTFENGMRVGVAGRNGLGKTTLLKTIMGQIQPTEGTVKVGQLTCFNYVDQGRFQLREELTALEEVSDGTEWVAWGEARLSLRAYLKRFLFADERISRQVKHLSGGERSRLLLARILKQGGNFLILDEPTNDLDLPTLRVLEEALIGFPGVVLVVSHDRYFLNRVCTDILAFEGNQRIAHSRGNYDYYLEKRARAEREHPRSPERTREPLPAVSRVPTSSPPKPRKLTWKETKELDGMENRILETESEIARIESLFSSPDFHRTHAVQTNQLKTDLATAKANLAQLYSRWEELEAIRRMKDSG
ncbi:MAG TPA: ABC-F family ATP-binding cassette domain-containing protein [Verrucomicrobiae bacterium]|nr:ABC-F family ATP-binding cassette domain-containing protein [Verrucomicrobiae bacterium]